MKALLIVGLVIIGNSNACADFSLEAKCLKDERTGIIITYNDSGEPIVVKDCENPESAKLGLVGSPAFPILITTMFLLGITYIL